MIAVDTNVLVYAHRAETALHQAATRRLVAMAEGRGLWGLPVFCAGEFIRVVTHRRVFNPPSTLDEAIQFLERVVAALCRKHGVSTLLTNDCDFARFEGLRLSYLDAGDA